MRIAVNLIFTLALLVGVILLQIYLSKRESKWPGLVLPIIAFLFGSLYLILSILVDTFISKISLPMQPVPEIGSISGA